MIHATYRPYLWMLLGSFSSAWTGILAHEAGAAFDWQLIAVVRCAMSLGIVAFLALGSGVKLVFFRPGVLWLRSLAGSCSLIGTFYALPLLPVADVFTLINIFPIWVALLSWPLLGEALNKQVWLSVVSGVMGVALIQQPHLASANYVIRRLAAEVRSLAGMPRVLVRLLFVKDRARRNPLEQVLDQCLLAVLPAADGQGRLHMSPPFDQAYLAHLWEGSLATTAATAAEAGGVGGSVRRVLNRTHSITGCESRHALCWPHPFSNRACSMSSGGITLLKPTSRSRMLPASYVGSPQHPCRIVTASLRPWF